jgi:hypothetical protein
MKIGINVNVENVTFTASGIRTGVPWQLESDSQLILASATSSAWVLSSNPTLAYADLSASASRRSDVFFVVPANQSLNFMVFPIQLSRDQLVFLSSQTGGSVVLTCLIS